MKKGNWVPIDKTVVQYLGNLNRPYSIVEAVVSHECNLDCGNPWTINGYAKLWQWSRNKVRRFVTEYGTPNGHSPDTRGTPNGHPVHRIDTGLWGEKDTQGTPKGHSSDTQRDTISNPNPNPNKKPGAKGGKSGKKKYGFFNNVLLTDEQFEKLKDEFNSHLQEKIDTLSEGIASKGYKYKCHYATILAWDRRKKAKGGKSHSDTVYEKLKAGAK